MDKELFIEWARLVKNIRDFNEQSSDNFHNAPYALQKCKDLLGFMKKEAPALREWCNRYLEDHRDEIYAKLWIEIGWGFFNSSNSGTGNLRLAPREQDIHPDFQHTWNRICSIMGQTEQNDFQFAYTKLMETHRIHSIEFCDIPEILKIHEGKDCINNGWFCWLCDDMEEKWHRHLAKKLLETKSIFFDSAEKGKFLQKAIEAKLAPFGWKPPLSQRNVPAILLQTEGKTATQIMYKIVEFASWQIKIFSLDSKDEYKKFTELWDFIENLEPKLEVLEGACRQVEEFVHPL